MLSLILETSQRLTPEHAVILYRDAPLHSLRSAANIRRKQMNGDREVTYLIDRNINYTNVCTINCQFCSFYRPPGHKENYTQTIEQISHRVSELEQIEGVGPIVANEIVEFWSNQSNCIMVDECFVSGLVIEKTINDISEKLSGKTVVFTGVTSLSDIVLSTNE